MYLDYHSRAGIKIPYTNMVVFENAYDLLACVLEINILVYID